MATKCYTDAEIAAIIAAASGGSAPEIQMLALSDTDRFGNTREMDNRAAPGMSLAERLIGGNRVQNTQLSPAARLALAPTLSEWDRNQFLSGALFEKYPELFTTIPPRRNNVLGPPVGGATPVLGAPTPAQQPQPTNGTTQAGAPDAIFSPGQPVPTNGGSDMNDFSCPSPSAGTCFSDIPRADVSEIVQFSYTDGSPDSVVLPIDLDNVRGMRLCSISGIFGSNGPVAPELYQTLFFYGTYTLHFRGQTVPGWTDRPLSEILSDPGCCDPEVVEVNCLIPEYGGLEMEVNLNGFGPGPDVNFAIATRLKFSGCGCSSASHGDCGCGGGSVRRRIQ